MFYLQGNFEVSVDGELVHSKTTRGQGRCETPEEQQKLIDSIQAIMDK
jgi:hypothetical protein